MTRKQIEALKKTLPSLMEYENWTEEQKILHQELCCRAMINSIMIYGNINSPYDEKNGVFDKYLMGYMNGEYTPVLPCDRVIELIKEQQADFAKATVKYAVSKDTEGCIYSSITWADEIEEA